MTKLMQEMATVSELVDGMVISGKTYYILSNKGEPLRDWAISRRCQTSVEQAHGRELCNYPSGYPDFHNNDGTLGVVRRGGAWWITIEAVMNANAWYAQSRDENGALYGTYPRNGKQDGQKFQVNPSSRIYNENGG